MLEIVACEACALHALKSRFRKKKIYGSACACVFSTAVTWVLAFEIKMWLWEDFGVKTVETKPEPELPSRQKS